MPSSEPFHIRSMAEADLDAVQAIEQASYPVPWRREHFLHELTTAHAYPFVAEAAGSILGYVCLMSLFEEAQILNIAVAPHERGRGIARTLLAHAVRVARDQGAEVLCLEVRASNRAAIALYTSFGFIPCGLRPGYYEGKEDALLMEKPLQGDH